MSLASPSLLSDQELLDATTRVANSERRTTKELVELLAELDTRKLYLGEGYSSLFTYCTQVLRLSEAAAYSRITATRVARRWPMILPMLIAGDITLTTVSLLSGHLTDENAESLLDAARTKNRRDVERLVAALYAQPDIPSSMRRVSPAAGPSPDVFFGTAVTPTNPEKAVEEPTHAPRPARPAVAAVGSDRYLLRITVPQDVHDKLQRARDLLRHIIPSGDSAAIIARALTVLVEELERSKIAVVQRACAPKSRSSRGRHVPASVRRAVWARDQGRCAFIGANGRCNETGFLEFHHVLPFAVGGPTTAENLELRCRAHNQFEAELVGLARPDVVSRRRTAQ